MTNSNHCNTTAIRNQRIDALRALSCISVVFMHAISLFWIGILPQLQTVGEYNLQLADYIAAPSIATYGSIQWYECSILDAVTRFSVPMFVLMSGYLVLQKERVPIVYGLKKVVYVVRIICVWGCLLALLLGALEFYIEGQFSLTRFFQNIVNGGGVFWFLYMLAPLYLASPIFKSIVKDNDSTRLFLILWFVFSIILPIVKSIQPSIGENIKFEYLSLFSSYSGYFLLGGYFANGGGKNIKGGYLYLFGILAMLAMSFMMPVGLFHNFTTPLCVLYTISVFKFIMNCNVQWITCKLMLRIATLSLPIYALHPFFLKLLSLLWKPSAEWFHMQVLIYAILAIFASYILAKLAGYFKLFNF